MSIWLFRAGKVGEYENKFLEENRIYLTWEGLDYDLSKLTEQRELYELLHDLYPDNKMGRLRNWSGQIWPIAKRIEKDDLIILPSKFKSSIHIGRVVGDYVFDASNEDPYKHYRKVEWIKEDIPRSTFDQDLLYSFGAFMTVCKIERNNAEERIRAILAGKKIERPKTSLDNDEDASDTGNVEIDLEEVATDQIAKYLIRKFKGHGLSVLIEEILKSKGFSTFRSPSGPDKGVDILASSGLLGFGSPKICVQVKSGDSPVDRPTLDQLIGTMQNFSADQGLLVSWGGFKRSVQQEIANQFFRVRLWGQKEIIEQLLANYSQLDDEIKAELPLKRIWALNLSDED